MSKYALALVGRAEKVLGYYKKEVLTVRKERGEKKRLAKIQQAEKEAWEEYKEEYEEV